MANYISTLQAENAALKAVVTRQEKMIANFRVHLQSAKFHNDTTIQTSDVDAWMVNMWRNLAVDAGGRKCNGRVV